MRGHALAVHESEKQPGFENGPGVEELMVEGAWGHCEAAANQTVSKPVVVGVYESEAGIVPVYVSGHLVLISGA